MDRGEAGRRCGPLPVDAEAGLHVHPAFDGWSIGTSWTR
jgi:hypothetical protein